MSDESYKISDSLEQAIAVEAKAHKFFNVCAVHVLQTCPSIEGPSAATLSLETQLQIALDCETERATWQEGASAKCLGGALVLLSLLTIALAVWVTVNALSGGTILQVSLLFWVWGAIGGTLMGVYGYVHHWIYRTIDPAFTWWSLTKGLSGAVMGAVAATLVATGITTAGTETRATSGVLIAVAFAAGFKEQYFLAWLSQLGPGQKPGNLKKSAKGS